MDEMKQVGGVWLPSHETHMTEWMRKRSVYVDGKLTYQYHKLQAAMPFVKQFRVAVDVGAHVGFWSMHLAKKFAALHAFEPMALHRQCFERNVAGIGNWCLHPIALGDKKGLVSLHTTIGSSGDTWVDPSVEVGDTVLETLDSYTLDHVDFIKLDCEGYELFALRGGEQTLLRCKPCIVVEQKHSFAEKYGLKKQEAVEYLIGLGAKLRKEWSGDFILSWD